MPAVLTVTQAEKHTGIHRRTILRAITAGHLKATKAGGKADVWSEPNCW
jgi:excisionase family DNA binding protein